MDSEKVTISASDVGQLEVGQPKTKSLEERIAADEPITREEAVKHFKGTGVKYTCRGRRIHTPEEEATLLKRYQSCVTMEDCLAFKKELEDKFKIRDSDRKTVTNLEEAHRAILPMIHAFADSIGQRKNTCGADVGELILADGKFDGERHEVTCKKCGQKHTYVLRYNLSD